MQSVLDQLKTISRVVADTGDFELIKKYKPVDATTNPSLILKAVKDPKYKQLVYEVINSVKSNNKNLSQKELTHEVILEILVTFGVKILEVIDGKVSSEVDARVSFDTEQTIKYARNIISKYQQKGTSKERVLIKIAATWEGIKAAEILQKEGINCNLTLIFEKAQAQACAEADVYLISPFVGRITDWQMKETNLKEFPETSDDDGVNSVKSIYQLYKSKGFKTIVMGASFRNAKQVTALAGCDALTISPALLDELESLNFNLEAKLDSSMAKDLDIIPVTETSFRWQMNENAMANYKLAEGIRLFAKDTAELENIINEL